MAIDWASISNRKRKLLRNLLGHANEIRVNFEHPCEKGSTGQSTGESLRIQEPLQRLRDVWKEPPAKGGPPQLQRRKKCQRGRRPKSAPGSSRKQTTQSITSDSSCEEGMPLQAPDCSPDEAFLLGVERKRKKLLRSADLGDERQVLMAQLKQYVQLVDQVCRELEDFLMPQPAGDMREVTTQIYSVNRDPGKVPAKRKTLLAECAETTKAYLATLVGLNTTEMAADKLIWEVLATHILNFHSFCRSKLRKFLVEPLPEQEVNLFSLKKSRRLEEVAVREAFKGFAKSRHKEQWLTLQRVVGAVKQLLDRENLKLQRKQETQLRRNVSIEMALGKMSSENPEVNETSLRLRCVMTNLVETQTNVLESLTLLGCSLRKHQDQERMPALDVDISEILSTTAQLSDKLYQLNLWVSDENSMRSSDIDIEAGESSRNMKQAERGEEHLRNLLQGDTRKRRERRERATDKFRGCCELVEKEMQELQTFETGIIISRHSNAGIKGPGPERKIRSVAELVELSGLDKAVVEQVIQPLLPEKSPGGGEGENAEATDAPSTSADDASSERRKVYSSDERLLQVHAEYMHTLQRREAQVARQKGRVDETIQFKLERIISKEVQREIEKQQEEDKRQRYEMTKLLSAAKAKHLKTREEVYANVLLARKEMMQWDLMLEVHSLKNSVKQLQELKEAVEIKKELLEKEITDLKDVIVAAANTCISLKLGHCKTSPQTLKIVQDPFEGAPPEENREKISMFVSNYLKAQNHLPYGATDSFLQQASEVSTFMSSSLAAQGLHGAVVTERLRRALGKAGRKNKGMRSASLANRNSADAMCKNAWETSWLGVCDGLGPRSFLLRRMGTSYIRCLDDVVERIGLVEQKRIEPLPRYYDGITEFPMQLSTLERAAERMIKYWQETRPVKPNPSSQNAVSYLGKTWRTEMIEVARLTCEAAKTLWHALKAAMALQKAVGYPWEDLRPSVCPKSPHHSPGHLGYFSTSGSSELHVDEPEIRAFARGCILKRVYWTLTSWFNELASVLEAMRHGVNLHNVIMMLSGFHAKAARSDGHFTCREQKYKLSKTQVPALLNMILGGILDLTKLVEELKDAEFRPFGAMNDLNDAVNAARGLTATRPPQIFYMNNTDNVIEGALYPQLCAHEKQMNAQLKTIFEVLHEGLRDLDMEDTKPDKFVINCCQGLNWLLRFWRLEVNLLVQVSHGAHFRRWREKLQSLLSDEEIKVTKRGSGFPDEMARFEGFMPKLPTAAQLEDWQAVLAAERALVTRRLEREQRTAVIWCIGEDVVLAPSEPELLDHCRPKLFQESNAGAPLCWGFASITDLDLELRVLLGAFDRSRPVAIEDLISGVDALRSAELAPEAEDEEASPDEEMDDDVDDEYGGTEVQAHGRSSLLAFENEDKDENEAETESREQLKMEVTEDWGVSEVSASPGLAEPQFQRQESSQFQRQESRGTEISNTDRESALTQLESLPDEPWKGSASDAPSRQISSEPAKGRSSRPSSVAELIAARDKAEVEHEKHVANRRQSHRLNQDIKDRAAHAAAIAAAGVVEKRRSTVKAQGDPRQLLTRRPSKTMQKRMDQHAAVVVASHDEQAMVETLIAEEHELENLVEQFNALDSDAKNSHVGLRVLGEIRDAAFTLKNDVTCVVADVTERDYDAERDAAADHVTDSDHAVERDAAATHVNEHKEPASRSSPADEDDIDPASSLEEEGVFEVKELKKRLTKRLTARMSQMLAAGMIQGSGDSSPRRKSNPEQGPTLLTENLHEFHDLVQSTPREAHKQLVGAVDEISAVLNQVGSLLSDESVTEAPVEQTVDKEQEAVVEAPEETPALPHVDREEHVRLATDAQHKLKSITERMETVSGQMALTQSRLTCAFAGRPPYGNDPEERKKAVASLKGQLADQMRAHAAISREAAESWEEATKKSKEALDGIDVHSHSHRPQSREKVAEIKANVTKIRRSIVKAQQHVIADELKLLQWCQDQATLVDEIRQNDPSDKFSQALSEFQAPLDKVQAALGIGVDDHSEGGRLKELLAEQEILNAEATIAEGKVIEAELHQLVAAKDAAKKRLTEGDLSEPARQELEAQVARMSKEVTTLGGKLAPLKLEMVDAASTSLRKKNSLKSKTVAQRKRSLMIACHVDGDDDVSGDADHSNTARTPKTPKLALEGLIPKDPLHMFDPGSPTHHHFDVPVTEDLVTKLVLREQEIAQTISASQGETCTQVAQLAELAKVEEALKNDAENAENAAMLAHIQATRQNILQNVQDLEKEQRELTESRVHALQVIAEARHEQAAALQDKLANSKKHRRHSKRSTRGSSHASRKGTANLQQVLEASASVDEDEDSDADLKEFQVEVTERIKIRQDFVELESESDNALKEANALVIAQLQHEADTAKALESCLRAAPDADLAALDAAKEDALRKEKAAIVAKMGQLKISKNFVAKKIEVARGNQEDLEELAHEAAMHEHLSEEVEINRVSTASSLHVLPGQLLPSEQHGAAGKSRLHSSTQERSSLFSKKDSVAAAPHFESEKSAKMGEEMFHILSDVQRPVGLRDVEQALVLHHDEMTHLQDESDAIEEQLLQEQVTLVQRDLGQAEQRVHKSLLKAKKRKPHSTKHLVKKLDEADGGVDGDDDAGRDAKHARSSPTDHLAGVMVDMVEKAIEDEAHSDEEQAAAQRIAEEVEKAGSAEVLEISKEANHAQIELEKHRLNVCRRHISEMRDRVRQIEAGEGAIESDDPSVQALYAELQQTETEEELHKLEAQAEALQQRIAELDMRNKMAEHRLKKLTGAATPTRDLKPRSAQEGHRHGAEGHKHGAEGHKHGAEGHKHGAEGHKHGAEGHKHGAEGHKHGAEGHKRDADGHKHGAAPVPKTPRPQKTPRKRKESWQLLKSAVTLHKKKGETARRQLIEQQHTLSGESSREISPAKTSRSPVNTPREITKSQSRGKLFRVKRTGTSICVSWPSPSLLRGPGHLSHLVSTPPADPGVELGPLVGHAEVYPRALEHGDDVDHSEDVDDSDDEHHTDDDDDEAPAVADLNQALKKKVKAQEDLVQMRQDQLFRKRGTIHKIRSTLQTFDPDDPAMSGARATLSNLLETEEAKLVAAEQLAQESICELEELQEPTFSVSSKHKSIWEIAFSSIWEDKVEADLLVYRIFECWRDATKPDDAKPKRPNDKARASIGIESAIKQVSFIARARRYGRSGTIKGSLLTANQMQSLPHLKHRALHRGGSPQLMLKRASEKQALLEASEMKIFGHIQGVSLTNIANALKTEGSELNAVASDNTDAAIITDDKGEGIQGSNVEGVRSSLSLPRGWKIDEDAAKRRITSEMADVGFTSRGSALPKPRDSRQLMGSSMNEDGEISAEIANQNENVWPQSWLADNGVERSWRAFAGTEEQGPPSSVGVTDEGTAWKGFLTLPTLSARTSEIGETAESFSSPDWIVDFASVRAAARVRADIMSSEGFQQRRHFESPRSQTEYSGLLPPIVHEHAKEMLWQPKVLAMDVNSALESYPGKLGADRLYSDAYIRHRLVDLAEHGSRASGTQKSIQRGQSKRSSPRRGTPREQRLQANARRIIQEPVGASVDTDLHVPETVPSSATAGAGYLPPGGAGYLPPGILANGYPPHASPAAMAAAAFLQGPPKVASEASLAHVSTAASLQDLSVAEVWKECLREVQPRIIEPAKEDRAARGGGDTQSFVGPMRRGAPKNAEASSNGRLRSVAHLYSGAEHSERANKVPRFLVAAAATK